MEYPTIKLAIDYILIDNSGSTAKTPIYYNWAKLTYSLHELERAEKELGRIVTQNDSVPLTGADDLWVVCAGENFEADGGITTFCRADGTVFTIDPWIEGFLREIFDKICE